MNLFELFGTISIKTSGANETIDATMEKVDGLRGSLDGVGTSADSTSTKINTGSKFDAACVWMGNMLTEITKKAEKLTFFLAKVGFGFNTSMESYQYQFEALIGDAEKASQLVADLQELAKISPLGMEGLANNAVTLLNTGTELVNILPTLEMLGNLSLGNSEKMNSVVRAYTQILGKGGLMAQEMYQLGDAMVPIVEIMTKYGGERYADGSWYQQKMSDPTFKIPAEDMVKAFTAATAEGGKWHDYMLTIMDSFAGQYDRLGEEGKETLGAFFQPFFDVAKSDVLPKLIEGLGEFRIWIDNNKEGIAKLADSVGNLVTLGFDNALSFFKWCVENQEEVTAAFGAITTVIAALVAKTHPWLAAISAVLAGLAEVSAAQKEIDAFGAKYGVDLTDTKAAARNKKTGREMLEGLYLGNRSVEISAELKEGAGNDLQNDLDAQDLSVDVKVNPIMNWLGSLFGGNQSFTYTSNSGKTHSSGIGDGFGANGSHANGLDRVPFDGYRAILHRDEAVLTANEARDWRSRQSNGELASMVAAAVRDAVAGIQFNVSLDGGALVGQLAPTMDRQLGTLASRKGRG